MSGNEPSYLEYLIGVSNDIKRYTANLADAADQHFDDVATQIRDTLSHASWLPESARPTPPPNQLPPVAPAANRVLALTSSPARLLRFTRKWISEHRAVCAATLSFAGTAAVLVYGMKLRQGRRRRRRAKRAANGARIEVIVIIGPPAAPLIRSLALDLERRGFIVYIVVNALEDEQLVHDESRVDIRPLLLDIGNSSNTEEAMKRFRHLLSTPQQAVPGAASNKLQLTGVILAPELLYPSGPIETISMESWSDTINVQLLNTIAAAKEFLNPVCRFKSRFLMLTPNNIPSIQPPFHALQNTVIGALNGFFTTLQNELDTINIRICHFKLGMFDYGALSGHHLQQQRYTALGRNEASTLSWPASSRLLYAQNYLSQLQIAGLFPNNRQRHSGQVGAPLRELHLAVFDALTQERPARKWHVGHGSLIYEMVGRLFPRGVVVWMLGMKKVSHLPEKIETSPTEEKDSALDASHWEEVENAV